MEDLGAVFDEHVRAEFAQRDAAAAMATMTDSPYLTHVPTLTGAVGREEVRRYYAEHFIPRWPADTKVIPISRTVGVDQVVDELIVCFTHDIVMDTVLPGVPPTGRYVEAPHVVVVKFENGRIAHEHIYWDQASVLVQIGLLDPSVLPVTGVEQSKRLQGEPVPLNALIER